MSSKTTHEYTINRVKVQFPCKAYPSQLAMMSKIIMALQKSQNALLESPTGSGKSLALLCGALAWQESEFEKVKEYNNAVEQGLIEPEIVQVDPDDPSSQDESEENALVATKGGFWAKDEIADDFDDFKSVVNGPDIGKRDNNGDSTDSRPSQGISDCPQQQPTRKVRRKTVPKIYFGTRTHKQISQIIRELNKTKYRGAKMTILGSRDHTCIHPTVSKMTNRNEACRELTDRKLGSGCSYMSNVKAKVSTHAAVSSYRGSLDAWDLEDLVKVGKKVRACPFYASRELMAKSEIIFCPYNYLIEPSIRKSMDINLKGQIVILDEAHNIEDSARSAASWEVNEDHILEVKNDLEAMVEANILPGPHKIVASMCSRLSSWIHSCESDLNDYDSFSSSSKVWTGTEIIAVFNNIGIGRNEHEELMTNIARVISEWQDQKDNEKMESTDSVALHANTINFLEEYSRIMENLFMDGMKHIDDYRVALKKTQVRKKSTVPMSKRLGTWLKRDSITEDGARIVNTFSLNFWCLNPAVSFLELKKNLRSIIVTSGTLSPMASFSSELDVQFPLTLEANHVIDRKQVWISTLSAGPTGHSLNATYRCADTFGFQDELGKVVLRVCQTVPHGVLLFLPSYALLNKLAERWRQTGLFSALETTKRVMLEPRKAEEFEACLLTFNDIIEATNHVEKASNGEVDGALLIAVCRGKVSEGMDFADNSARAVICVGIPFPNIKDIQVDLKKKYNDSRKTAVKTILSGNEWYEIQAFRALNQALGRCIRHKNDWGAIIMVDDRFQRIHRYIGSLSKWVRSGVTHFSNCQAMLGSLKSFSEQMTEMDKARIAEENSKAVESPVKHQGNDSARSEPQEILPVNVPDVVKVCVPKGSRCSQKTDEIATFSFAKTERKKPDSDNLNSSVDDEASNYKKRKKNVRGSVSSEGSVGSSSSSARMKKKPCVVYVGDSDEDFV